MTDSERMCCACVFWRARGDDGDVLARGHCRARLLDFADPSLAVMTQADFVCDQWCGKAAMSEAAE